MVSGGTMSRALIFIILGILAIFGVVIGVIVGNKV